MSVCREKRCDGRKKIERSQKKSSVSLRPIKSGEALLKVKMEVGKKTREL